MPDDEEGIAALQCLTQPMDLLTMLYKVCGCVAVISVCLVMSSSVALCVLYADSVCVG